MDWVLTQLIGLLPQGPPTPLVTAMVTEGIVQFLDPYGHIVDPLSFKHTVILGSETTGSAEVCLVEPKGVGSLGYVYVDGYLIWAEGQLCGLQSTAPQGEYEGTGDVTVVVNRACVSCTAVAYNCEERQEPHNEGEPKLVSAREPPAFLPPKRDPRLMS